MKTTLEKDAVRGSKLGLSGRQAHAEYTWPKIVKLSEKESGTNRLRLELQILHWCADTGQQADALPHEPPSDVRGALARARRLLEQGDSMAEVRGIVSRAFGGRIASVNIATFEADEERRDPGTTTARTLRSRVPRLASREQIVEVVRTKYPNGRIRARVHTRQELRGGALRKIYEGSGKAPGIRALYKRAKEAGIPIDTPIQATVLRDPTRSPDQGSARPTLHPFIVRFPSAGIAKMMHDALTGAHDKFHSGSDLHFTTHRHTHERIRAWAARYGGKIITNAYSPERRDPFLGVALLGHFLAHRAVGAAADAGMHAAAAAAYKRAQKRGKKHMRHIVAAPRRRDPSMTERRAAVIRSHLPKASNRAKGKLELHEFMTRPPEKLFAYYKGNAQVGDAITTWMGDVLGTVIHRGKVTHPMGGSVVSIRVRGKNGLEYAGRCNLSSGTYCNLRRVASSRRDPAHVLNRRDPTFAKGHAFAIDNGEGLVWPQGSLQKAKKILSFYIDQGWPKSHIVARRYDQPGAWKRWTPKSRRMTTLSRRDPTSAKRLPLGAHVRSARHPIGHVVGKAPGKAQVMWDKHPSEWVSVSELKRLDPAKTRVQALLFEPLKHTARSALAWARKHGFRASKKVHTTARYHRVRLEEPGHFRRMRTVRFGRGVSAIVGVPKGN
jgi:hypothetical protein